MSGMPAESLEQFVADIFARLGVARDGARRVAAALIAADLEGVPSHGVMLVPMYVDRMLAGSVSRASEGTISHKGGFAVIIDAGHALGQLTAHQSMGIAIKNAKQEGVAVVAVKNAFHFGAAGYWAREIAAQGLIGIVMCNTRPLMPATGGAERLVGNNPLAVALPAAGPKGFGLAVAIDLLCGALSGGAVGEEVGALYGDPAKPYGCAHLFIALDPSRFTEYFPDRVEQFATRIRTSKPAAGTKTIYAPGDLERAKRETSGGRCSIPPDVLAKLNECGAKLGLKGIS